MPGDGHVVHTLIQRFPELSSPACCPIPGCVSLPLLFLSNEPKLSNVIVHLNDTHYWSRERIADWVESSRVQAAVIPGAGG